MSMKAPGVTVGIPPMPERARLIGINHVALEVGDLEAALDFYGRLFDVELRGRVPGMAFIDIGDQFIALSEGRTQASDEARHFGLVVDDRELVRERLEGTDAEVFGARGLNFRDPWGNYIQVVQYSDVQFERAPGVKRALGIEDLSKTESARQEIAEKGLE
jgi:catechol 2,3-dioxygenase-like lactoylglutathione lyase family enzyme